MSADNRSWSHGHVDDVVIEPVPDWPDAKEIWGLAWPFHIYGLGSAFLLLLMYDIAVVIHLNKRLKSHPLLLGTTLIMFLFAGTKVLMFFFDPYESRGLLPLVLARVSQGLTFPCMTSSFTMMQMLIMRITRVTIGPSRIHKHRIVRALFVTHFAIVLVIYSVVSYHVSFKLTIMITQSIFITWGLVLCFTFIYNGFKVAQFTNETHRVLKEITLYSKVRKEALKSGNQRDLALHRISKPRMREELSDSRVMSEGSNDSGAESSDSLSFFNEAHLELDEETLAKIYQNRFQNAKCLRSHPKEKKTTTKRNNFDRSQLRMALSSESDYVTDAPSPSNTSGFSTEERNMGPCRLDYACFSLSPTNASKVGMYVPIPSPNSSVREKVSSNESTPVIANSHINPAFDKGQEASEPADVTTSEHAPFIKLDHGNNNTFTRMADQETEMAMDVEDNQEGGYMADTEFGSPKRTKKRFRLGKGGTTEEPEEIEPGGSPTHMPYPLPLSDGTLGLYRIRQGRIIRKVLKVTYVATLTLFLSCVLQLYAMFGVYGVLSKEKVAQPWPWYVFHTCSRVSELGTGLTLTWICHRLGRQRHNPARRKRRKPAENQTRC